MGGISQCDNVYIKHTSVWDRGGGIMVKNSVTSVIYERPLCGIIRGLNRLIYCAQNMLLVHGLFP